MTEVSRAARFVQGLSEHFDTMAKRSRGPERRSAEQTAYRYRHVWNTASRQPDNAVLLIVEALEKQAGDEREGRDYHRLAASLRNGTHLLPFAHEIQPSSGMGSGFTAASATANSISA